jgi:hypothetical protein
VGRAGQDFAPCEPVPSAVNFFVRCRQSMAGRMRDFATLSRTRVRRGMNEQAAAWLSAVEGLPASTRGSGAWSSSTGTRST